MSTELSFKLVRVAKKSGGDRYEAEINEHNPMVIYIPQKLGRKEGVPVKEIKVRFDLVQLTSFTPLDQNDRTKYLTPCIQICYHVFLTVRLAHKYSLNPKREEKNYEENDCCCTSTGKERQRW